MDIVNFWKIQVEKWNDELKCDSCWTFGAPLIESAVNIQQYEEDKECCIKVLFLRQGVTAFSTVNTYNASTGLRTNVVCNKSFQLLVLLDSKLGLNNFNEIKGNPESESVWSTKLSKIEECLACDANIDFCEILGNSYRITQWSGVQVLNYQNSNYSGYRLTVNFQNNV